MSGLSHQNWDSWQLCIFMHTHSHTLTHTHSLTHTNSHTFTHTHSHTHSHTLTHTHTHTQLTYTQSPATPQVHPQRDSAHPLTLVARGELPSNGLQTTAEHALNGSHTLHGNTPTPSAQQRTLPGLPGTSLSQAPGNSVMETIHEEREKERNDAVVYERLAENVTLSERHTDSGTVKV